jgi:hypothetical protein
MNARQIAERVQLLRDTACQTSVVLCRAYLTEMPSGVGAQLCWAMTGITLSARNI